MAISYVLTSLVQLSDLTQTKFSHCQYDHMGKILSYTKERGFKILNQKLNLAVLNYEITIVKTMGEANYYSMVASAI